ncbi:laminin subunit beta-1-like [Saccoglossus kowalevskii]|uniref:Laminin subunit beta-1-like n=1 Tax=Saccoglossus kowalevskii TaxID=10224 RepID=A0ABM0N148_SACKO|nr:PREDICTED: laminin subunit beta-1-like [Saccoglossus kowalevskii]
MLQKMAWCYFLCLLACYGASVLGQEPSCEGGGCYPATGDLLIGRKEQLSSSSTCGLERPERFCIVSHLTDITKCFYCDSRNSFKKGVHVLSHRIENVVTSFDENRKETWWQSENGREDVFIQLDLEAEFHFTHLIMTFKTFRPAAMFVERSSDFGRTWKIYRYFAYNCEESFPGIKHGHQEDISETICESRYSAVEPSTEGEVIFRVLPPNLQVNDPYAADVQDLLRVTNLRINFTKLHTLGDNLLDNREEIKEKYYYALYDMVVRGSCQCYGHASRCIPLEGMSHESGMVYGNCDCTHNTKGLNCEQCEDFYNDLPWRPAAGGETNACKRCNCNNHASRCHFDPAVYEQTGQISGGVCDNCQHNTLGRNCEQCRPFFYMDPSKDIRDPNVCVPCNCDPSGAVNGGECESREDRENGLVAGRCICKRFVEGDRCDVCRDGYWNLEYNNPEGCQPCSCALQGTVGNQGCHKRTGQCVCKRLVTGRDCNECLDGYWGLSDDPDGCKPCDCDIGGSYDNLCEKSDGQCRCKRNIIGRRCDMAEPGFFVPGLDMITYEAELNRGIGPTTVEIREQPDGTVVTWTGPGFMRIREGGSVEFIVDNIPTSMEYDVMLRYEPQMPETWEDVRVTVTRPTDIPTSSVCGNTIPQDDLLATSLLPGQRHRILSRPVCLERGTRYTIRVDFNRYHNGSPTPAAQILFDSLVLVPTHSSLPMFQGPGPAEERREQYERYRCQETQMSVLKPPMPEICEDLIFSMSASMYDGAVPCNCDQTGSVSSVCGAIGGQCECKSNVIGRRCDRCSPGTYGFGPQGCQLCDCNQIGSRSLLCDVNSGQCPCNLNTYGRQCDLCERGYWNFPNCQPCQCNGHADTCDSRTGTCEDCRDNTAGQFCQICALGFYGDPREGSGQVCQPCMCPGGAGSGFQFADSCYLDPRSQTVICECKEGYTGIRCDQCDNNFFGNPLIPGGGCQNCSCNGNIDPSVPGNCDARTGECLRCLYNTEGTYCENCKPGFYGDALNKDCKKCVCNILGTDRSVCDNMNNCGICDSNTGQCPCLPNVEGRNCDRCTDDYWKLASGTGCELCNCCSYGSVSSQCNEFDGQCQCRPGFGGRQCCDCEADFWGDPLVECKACNCDPDGSESLQCDRDTGVCLCKEGVTGDKCDRCDRGTSGDLPNCEPCGECFDDWDDIIQDLKNQTDYEIDRAQNIKHTGAPGAYDDEFQEMEDKLDKIKKLLVAPNVTEAEVEDLQKDLADIRDGLTGYEKQLDEIEDDLPKIEDRKLDADDELDRLEKAAGNLAKKAKDLEDNVTDISLSDVEGAFNSIKESQNKSQMAQDKVDATEPIIEESEEIRDELNKLIKDRQDELDQNQKDNEDALNDLDNQLAGLEAKLKDVNEMVCGAPGDECSTCGGAGCGECGGLGCAGAVPVAEQALTRAQDADDKLREKEKEANDMLDEVQMAEDDANDAKDKAQMAYDAALQAKTEAEGAQTNLTDLLDAITDFLHSEGAKPSDIRRIAEKVLAMKISLTPDEIRELAKEINETIQNLENVDDILDATKDDLDRAKKLKEDAEKTKDFADGVLDKARNVVEALDDADKAQQVAEDAIDKADDDIKAAEEALLQIESETSAALEKARDSLNKVEDMDDQLDDVKRKFTDNEINIDNAAEAAKQADELADDAQDDADNLQNKYTDAAKEIDDKISESNDALERAEKLKDDATALESETRDKLQELDDIKGDFDNNEDRLGNLADELGDLNDEMSKLLADIERKAQFYRTCQPGT